MIAHIKDDRIKQAVIDVARDLSNSQPNVVICALAGGFMFFSDVVKNMTHFDFEMDFIKSTSYQANGKTTSTIQVSGPFCGTSLRDKRVVVIEDIIDRGDTIIEVIRFLKNYGPKELQVRSLLERKTAKIPEELRSSILSSIIVEDESWLIGYGLDHNGYKRTFQNIYKLK